MPRSDGQVGESAARRVTFHHVPVRDGQDIYVQPNEQVMDVEYDPEGSIFHVLLMAEHDGPPDGGDAPIDSRAAQEETR